jgi:hypothetical protein
MPLRNMNSYNSVGAVPIEQKGYSHEIFTQKGELENSARLTLTPGGMQIGEDEDNDDDDE